MLLLLVSGQLLAVFLYLGFFPPCIFIEQTRQSPEWSHHLFPDSPDEPIMRTAYRKNVLRVVGNHNAVCVFFMSKCDEVKGRSSPDDAQRGQNGTWGDPRRGCGQLPRTEGSCPGPLLRLGSWGVGVALAGDPSLGLLRRETWAVTHLSLSRIAALISSRRGRI